MLLMGFEHAVLAFEQFKTARTLDSGATVNDFPSSTGQLLVFSICLVTTERFSLNQVRTIRAAFEYRRTDRPSHFQRHIPCDGICLHQYELPIQSSLFNKFNIALPYQNHTSYCLRAPTVGFSCQHLSY
jgi:hypothetical protein